MRVAAWSATPSIPNGLELSGQHIETIQGSDMSKRQESKYKIDRRLNVNLWGRAKSPISKREYGPGQHGQRRKKPSEFGLQLMAKQKLKGYYGNIGERQFRRIFAEAARRKGDTGEHLVALLERRVDAIVYRAKFAPTIFAARQLVNHGHVKVNGRRVTISSYRVKDDDIIELKEKSREMALVLEATASGERDIPDYLNVDHKSMKATFLRSPQLADVPYPVQMEPQRVVEYYSS
jgi:small subunit ribosomal protein S4